MPERKKLTLKFDEFSESIEKIESDTREKWMNVMPVKIDNNLSKSLFVMKEDYSLKLNFTDEVSVSRINLLSVPESLLILFF